MNAEFHADIAGFCANTTAFQAVADAIPVAAARLAGGLQQAPAPVKQVESKMLTRCRSRAAGIAAGASCYDERVSRVRIGTCSGLADAALVRSIFTAHDIDVVVGTEHHAGVLTGLGGGFVSLDIWIDEEDREEALALLHDLRDPDLRCGAENENEDEDEDGKGHDQDAGNDAAGARPDARDAPGDSLHLRIDRRRRTAVVLLLGSCITFGTAHMFTRAWMRGIMLAAVEIIGLMHVWNRHAAGGGIIASAVLADMIGALWRVRAAPPPALPVARIVARIRGA
jgi:hypothetical protein